MHPKEGALIDLSAVQQTQLPFWFSVSQCTSCQLYPELERFYLDYSVNNHCVFINAAGQILH